MAISIVAFVALAIAGIATYTAYSHSQLTQIDDTLQRSHEPIEEAVSTDEGGDLQRAVEQAAPGLFVAVLNADGTLDEQVAAREVGHEPLFADLDDLTMPPADTGDFVDRPYFSTLA